MSKYRIYELARDYKTSSKVIIDILARNNIAAKNHMSSVGDEAKAIIDHTFARKTETVGKLPVTPQSSVKSNGQKTPESGHPTVQHPVPKNTSALPQRSEKVPHVSRERNQHSADRPQSNVVDKSSHLNHANQHVSQVKPSSQVSHQPAAKLRTGTVQAKQNNTVAAGSSTRPQNNGKTKMQYGGKNHNNYSNNRNRSGQQSHNNHSRPNTHRYNPAPIQPKVEPPKPKTIKLSGPLTVKELAAKMSRDVPEIIKKLMLMGTMATINQEIDYDTAVIVANEFGVTVHQLQPEEDPTEVPEIIDTPETLKPRPAVVTIMGHVDHGKTSLLDVIRKTHVTAHEAGGITQHIGAYQVNYQGKKIVFLDTPGHEAFTAMRARGAQVTDIAVLVIAADDGIMPQTIEAINHARSAKVPIIVAINKMDLPGANPERIKQQLTEQGLIPEDWGGDTITVPVSAHKGTGLNDLLEMILLVAEVQDLKANPNRPACGTIIEAKLDKGRGPVATALVQKGTLHVGDALVVGTTFGKVRAMINDRGEKVKKAGPSTPVEVLGLSDVPLASDILNVLPDEKIARIIAEKRIAKQRASEQKAKPVSLADIFQHIKEGELKDLNIVIKADVQGSAEALKQSLVQLTNEEVRVSIIHAGVGAINESDVMLASAANALIIGFNVRPDSNARSIAEKEKIDVRTYRVIYDAINDVKAAITGMLAPEYKEVSQGRVEVRKIISIPKNVVAGSYVLEGKITKASQVRIIRNSVVVHEGTIDSLRRFKDDVKEVAAGYECGISIENFRDIKEGDIIEAYVMETVKPKA